MEIDTPAAAAPHETRACRAVPDDWLDTGLTICPRCDRVTDIDTLAAHNHVHDVADARLRGEPLLTPLRMVVAGNHHENVAKEATR